MARKVEFNPDVAVDEATSLFWHNGYTNTALRQLLSAMGIGEGSFYNTFKSKQNLYLLCLKHYNETVGQRRLDALLGGVTAKESVRAFFKVILDELDDPATPRVCMLAGSVTSDVLSVPDLKDEVIPGLEELGRNFTETLEAGKRSGELPVDFQPEIASQIISTFLHGMFRVLGVTQTRIQMEKQIEMLLQGIGL